MGKKILYFLPYIIKQLPDNQAIKFYISYKFFQIG